ncbi:MAG: hypothetical protein IJL12_05970 [Selenomonadaceae bacterium]|nr:hypothetical protein [Selenomonadaceae bacterium]MBQ6131869.1 hypothetical protein [Selenomonadaceae bacterium]
MAKISIEIDTTNNYGKKNTTNVSYVNPQATNDKLRQFAQMLVALTNDTYERVTKITKESVI